MVSFPNCKINLGLQILQKRSDGFHELETCFYPIPLQDALEIIHNPEPEATDIICTVSGTAIAIEDKDNICVKAYHLLKKDFPQLPPVKVHLHKNIPIGAGLGGGSADGAFMLLLLTKKFNLQLSEVALIKYASLLGSDCAFFIKNKPCFAKGRGELLKEVSLDLSSYKIIIVNPGIHINTGWAFAQIQPDNNRLSLLEIIKQPIESWKDKLTNDFEEPIAKNYPTIKIIKEALYVEGAIYAAMSGSGSTVFGIFDKTATPNFNFLEHYFIKEVKG